MKISKASLAKNSVYNTIYSLLSLLFPLVTSAYVSRILMADGVGKVQYAQNITSYFVTLAGLGLPTYGIRCISRARDDKQNFSKTFSELIVINAITTTISIIAYGVLLLTVESFRNDIYLYIATGILVIFNYINIDWFYRGQEEYQYIVIRSIIIKILSIIALFALVHDRNDYVIYALITSLATVGNNIFNIYHARNIVKFQIRPLNLLQHVKPVLIFSVALLFGNVYSKIDTTMLGSMLTKDIVGYYGYAHRILQIDVTICTSISAVFLPRLSYLYKSNLDEFHKVVNKGIQILAFISLPLSIGTFLLAPYIIEVLFGTGFTPAIETLRIFTPLVIVLSFGNLVNYQLLVSTGKEKLIVPITGGAAIINIVLNLLLIPKYAQNGAALASVVTEFFINITEYVYVRSRLKVHLDIKAIGKGTLCSALMAVFILLISWTNLSIIWKLSLGFTIGVLVYFVANYIFATPLAIEMITYFKKKRCIINKD